MEREVVGNKALEEFRGRLLRWDELCAQLRELYYKYLDLAAFRSEKCYFPGRRCVRSWDRKYDLGDLTLMWTYIANTAPLCGRLMRALAEVEYEIRKRALESLEKYGGVEKKTNPSGKYEIVTIRLKKPVYGYLVLWNDKLYVVWKEFDDLPQNGRRRSAEVERRVVDVIGRYKRGERAEVEVEEYKIDREYERLWLEVPLPENVSKLLGGKSKAPVALFRNLGWLLSDDSRYKLMHESGNPGQVAMRVFDWIAIAIYAKRALSGWPFVFRMSVYNADKTKYGINPTIDVRAIGTVAEIIQSIYRQFGTVIGKPWETLTHGYAVLSTLREEAIRREGDVYVVDDVGSWIAFSATVVTLVLGDGYIMPFEFSVTSKGLSEEVPNGAVLGVRGLAMALGGTVAGKELRFQSWHMRLLLPTPPMPAFEKSVDLYNVLTNYPSVAVIEIGSTVYVLTHRHHGLFAIEKERATEWYEVVRQLGIRMEKDRTVLTYNQLKDLANLVPVRLLNELERESVKPVRPAPSPDLEAVRRVLEEIMKIAKITFGKRGKYEYVSITPNDKSKLWDIASMFKAIGIRVSVDRFKHRIKIYERKSVETIRRTMSILFSSHYIRRKSIL